MSYFNLHRTLALINVFGLLLLVTDNYLLPVTHVQKVYDHRSTVETHGGYRTHTTHSTDYINTVSGEEFQVPANWQETNIGLNGGDTFYIDKSALFRQPVTLYFKWQGSYRQMKMTILNNSYWGFLLTIYILIVSAIHLLPWQLIKRDNLNERLIFSGTALLALLLFFYFYH